MNYCVSGRQPNSILAQADEIKIRYEDRDKLFDFIKDFPEKVFILEIPQTISADEIDWDLLAAHSEKVNFILCLSNLGLIKQCHERKIKYYWAYPVFTWYELQSLINLNPCYILISAPLSFSLNKIKNKTNIPLRLVPNLACDDYIPRINGLYGSWIRPEDIELYEKYIKTCEFSTPDLSKEATFLHVYKDNAEWPGNLNLLITNLDINIDNKLIPNDFGSTRANCGQRCMENNTCHYCETAIIFANTLRSYARNKDEN